MTNPCGFAVSAASRCIGSGFRSLRLRVVAAVFAVSGFWFSTVLISAKSLCVSRYRDWRRHLVKLPV